MLTIIGLPDAMWRRYVTIRCGEYDICDVGMALSWRPILSSYLALDHCVCLITLISLPKAIVYRRFDLLLSSYVGSVKFSYIFLMLMLFCLPVTRLLLYVAYSRIVYVRFYTKRVGFGE